MSKYEAIDRAIAAEALLKDALEVMIDIEWVFDNYDEYFYCPVCKRVEGDGHTADCRLAQTKVAIEAHLKKIEGVEE